MGYASIIRAFGVTLLILGGAMLLPYFVAFMTPGEAADNYLYGAAVTLIAGSGCIVLSMGRRIAGDFRSAILVILLWWIVAPAFAAIPFMFTMGSFLDAYFEAVSALTTTGAWLSNEAAITNAPGMLWRGQLQWLGGLASLAIAAAIFIRPAFIGIDTLLPPFPRGDRASYLRAIRNATVGFFSAYLLLTTTSFIIQMLIGAPVLDAAVISMSVVSSGGFIPRADSLAAYPFAVTGALLPFMMLGGANFILITRLMQGKARRNRDVETGVYFLAILIVGVGFWVAADAGDIDLIPAQVFNAASLFSTNGILIGEKPTLPLALVTVIIGGSAVSTAGGFKILRWLVIIRRSREEIRRLIPPRGVFGKSNIANEFGVWIHFLGFTIILGALTLLTTLDGHSFDLAATAATAIFANAGPVIEMVEGAEAGYEVFSEPTRALFCAGMILGRLEAVVALAVFNHAFWRS